MEMRRSGFVKAVLEFIDRDLIVHTQLDDEQLYALKIHSASLCRITAGGREQMQKSTNAAVLLCAEQEESCGRIVCMYITVCFMVCDSSCFQ